MESLRTQYACRLSGQFNFVGSLIALTSTTSPRTLRHSFRSSSHAPTAQLQKDTAYAVLSHPSPLAVPALCIPGFLGSKSWIILRVPRRAISLFSSSGPHTPADCVFYASQCRYTPSNIDSPNAHGPCEQLQNNRFSPALDYHSRPPPLTSTMLPLSSASHRKRLSICPIPSRLLRYSARFAGTRRGPYYRRRRLAVHAGLYGGGETLDLLYAVRSP